MKNGEVGHCCSFSSVKGHLYVRNKKINFFYQFLLRVLFFHRGICYFFVEVTCASKDLHSGVFGGTV